MSDKTWDTEEAGIKIAEGIWTALQLREPLQWEWEDAVTGPVYVNHFHTALTFAEGLKGCKLGSQGTYAGDPSDLYHEVVAHLRRLSNYFGEIVVLS